MCVCAQEMTIKGIEPELNRMSAAYQEELSELRRIHQSQIEEIEATWHRRMASLRDKMDAEREQAVVTERENARNRRVVDGGSPLGVAHV